MILLRVVDQNWPAQTRPNLPEYEMDGEVVFVPLSQEDETCFNAPGLRFVDLIPAILAAERRNAIAWGVSPRNRSKTTS